MTNQEERERAFAQALKHSHGFWSDGQPVDGMERSASVENIRTRPRARRDGEAEVTITLQVYGTPVPKGSSRAMMSRHKNPALRHAILVPSESDENKARRQSWDQAIREAVREKVSGDPPFIGLPLTVWIDFFLKRPQRHWSTRACGGLKPSAPAFPAVKPDLDKLVRATLDPMNGIVWDDDSRIVRITTTKNYGTREGATIVIGEARE